MTDTLRADALGFISMPLGYELHQLDSGHWIWVETRTGRESEIDVSRWHIYYGACRDSKRLVEFPSGKETRRPPQSTPPDTPE